MITKILMGILVSGFVAVVGCNTNPSRQSSAALADGSKDQRRDMQRIAYYIDAIRQNVTDIAALVKEMEQARERLNLADRTKYEEWVRGDLTAALAANLKETKKVLARTAERYEVMSTKHVYECDEDVSK